MLVIRGEFEGPRWDPIPGIELSAGSLHEIAALGLPFAACGKLAA
jgi:hypothetical protein